MEGEEGELSVTIETHPSCFWAVPQQFSYPHLCPKKIQVSEGGGVEVRLRGFRLVQLTCKFPTPSILFLLIRV